MTTSLERGGLKREARTSMEEPGELFEDHITGERRAQDRGKAKHGRAR